MNPILLTEPQACEFLNLGRSTLRRLWTEKTIRPIKLGKSLRFSIAELERFVINLQAQADREGIC
jgi:excisionase family DNA binding protein